MSVGSGLVRQVTSDRTVGHVSVAHAYRELNFRRRIRRMRRVVIGSADGTRQHAEHGGRRVGPVLVTLTYAQETNWSSRDVSTYIKNVREFLRPRGIVLRYQWVIELTQKGKPHYHVLLWLPFGIKVPKPDQSGQWTHGHSNIKRARRPVGYLVKYATKGFDGDLPKGARLFGTGDPEPVVKHATHRAGLPTWLDDIATPESRCVRVPRVGWVERLTGLVHQTPFSIEVQRDAWGLVHIIIKEKAA